MSDIFVSKVNETYIKIDADNSVLRDLYEYLSFYIPNHKFHPKVKAGFWDGMIHLISSSGNVYLGLLTNVHDFAKDQGLSVEVDSKLTLTHELSMAEANEFVKNLNLPPGYELRDYQVSAFCYAVRNRRNFLLLPTAAGKTLVDYFTLRYFVDVLKLRGLVIVPDSGLLQQLYTDFKEYSEVNGWDVDAHLHLVSKDQKVKDSSKPIVVSTYQSAARREKEYFHQFQFLQGEEADTFKAKTLVYIGESMINAYYRNGVTGSLDGKTVNELVLQGLFGPIRRITTIRELQAHGHASGLRIKNLLLRPPEATVKAIRRTDKKDRDGNVIEEKWSWEDEKRWMAQNIPRNRFVANLAISMTRNTLVIFEQLDHGKLLYDMIKERAAPDRSVFYVAGDVDAKDREVIRKQVEKCQNAIVVSSRVFVRGTNIKNLHNIIRCALNKAKANNMQGIGRGLRPLEGKEFMTLYEIVDDLRWKTWENYGIKHLAERLEIYNSEGFDCKLYNIALNAPITTKGQP